MRRYRKFMMAAKIDRSEWAEDVELPLYLDVNTVVGMWADTDGGTFIDTQFDSYKVTESLEAVEAIVNDPRL